MKRLLILLLVLISMHSFGQKNSDMGTEKVRFSDSQKTVTAEIRPVNSLPASEPDRFYSWYAANGIRETQGGYSGRLLNGHYSEFYLNKNLKKEGDFDRGLKDGLWKDWTEEGILVSLVTWKNGLRQGQFSLFDEKGKLRQKGTYKNDGINGKFFTYDPSGQASVKKYRDGKEVVESGPVSFWSRINIFKKKR